MVMRAGDIGDFPALVRIQCTGHPTLEGVVRSAGDLAAVYSYCGESFRGQLVEIDVVWGLDESDVAEFYARCSRIQLMSGRSASPRVLAR